MSVSEFVRVGGTDNWGVQRFVGDDGRPFDCKDYTL